MKEPRVEDFDPKARPRLKSSLDDMPPILPPAHRSPSPAADEWPAPQPPSSQKPGNPATREAVDPGLREAGKPETREPRNTVLRQPGNPVSRQADIPAPRDEGTAGPDFGQVPLRKETFMFTHEESDDLEDVKIDMRRKYDVKTSKNDIARVAVHTAIADYKQRGAESTLVQILKKKQS